MSFRRRKHTRLPRVFEPEREGERERQFIKVSVDRCSRENAPCKTPDKAHGDKKKNTTMPSGHHVLEAFSNLPVTADNIFRR